MTIREKHINRWTIGLLFLVGSSFLFAYTIDHNFDLHFGKDGGLSFLASTRIISGSIFFLIIKQRKFSFPGIGVVASFLMYLSYMYFGGEIVYESALVDQLIVSGLIAFCGYLYSKYFERNVEVPS
jgi:hypothetical protein